MPVVGVARRRAPSSMVTLLGGVGSVRPNDGEDGVWLVVVVVVVVCCCEHVVCGWSG